MVAVKRPGVGGSSGNIPIVKRPEPKETSKAKAPSTPAPAAEGFGGPRASTQKQLQGTTGQAPLPPATGSKVKGDWMGGASPAFAQQLTATLSKLLPGAKTETVGPPPGAQVKAMTGDASLIGLSAGFIDPRASYADAAKQLAAQGIPRFEKLTPAERDHETAFATQVAADVAHFVAGAEILAKRDDLGTSIFEVDAMKRQYAPYGAGPKPADDNERLVRAEANHALHPTSVAVARLAFLKKLDELAALPPDDAKRQVFVTNGGCSAGKSTLTEIVKRQLGDIPFGAVWDAAGEGDALENAWVLEACQARGLKAVFGYADNDPTRKFADVLARGALVGRIVDVMTFANSYIEGSQHMRDFLASPAYQKAAADGTATAVGVYTGRFDTASLKDKSVPAYPDLHTLGRDGLIQGADVPPKPDLQTVATAALQQLETWVTEQRGQGKDVDFVVNAALTASMKFLEQQS